MSERTPPHSLDAERAALGSVIIKPMALDDLNVLEVDDFFLPVHREIFDAMRAIAMRKRAVDWVGIADELKARDMLKRLEGGESYLLALANATPTAENVQHYVKIIAEKATARRLIASCAGAMSAAYADNLDIEELVADHRRQIGEIELGSTKGPTVVADTIDDVLKSMENRQRDPDGYLVPTGLTRFDRRFGGLRENHLIVVAARPGGGKTAWAVNVAVNAAVNHNIPVLIFSVEMSMEELIERMLSRQARVNGRAVSRGTMDFDDWKKISLAAGQLSYTQGPEEKKIPLYIDDRKHKASRICAEARRWRARHPDPRALIVIDYLGLVEPDADERTREREVAKMSRSFKLLAHKDQARAPVILCCQLNRDMIGKDGKMRRPVLRDLRESGAIEADADAVIFPWWEGKPPAMGRHPAELIIEKIRGGHPSSVPVDWEGEYTSFVDRQQIQEDDPQEELEFA